MSVSAYFSALRPSIAGGKREATCIFERRLITEVKAVEHVLGIHEAQLLTYMKLPQAPVGLLINFNVKLLTQGVRRMFL